MSFVHLLNSQFAEVFPQPIEGCKMVINKGLSNHFQISHTLSLGAFSPSSYHFGTTYVGSNQISPSEVSMARKWTSEID